MFARFLVLALCVLAGCSVPIPRVDPKRVVLLVEVRRVPAELANTIRSRGMGATEHLEALTPERRRGLAELLREDKAIATRRVVTASGDAGVIEALRVVPYVKDWKPIRVGPAEVLVPHQESAREGCVATLLPTVRARERLLDLRVTGDVATIAYMTRIQIRHDQPWFAVELPTVSLSTVDERTTLEPDGCGVFLEGSGYHGNNDWETLLVVHWECLP